MKPIVLHPVSVLAGLALAGVLTVLAGATQSSGTVHQIPTHDVHFVGGIPAEWWTYVQLSTASDGTPTESYTIPLNRHFVVTHIEVPTSTTVRADGIDVRAPLRGVHSDGVPNGTRVPLPPGALLTVDYNGTGSFENLWAIWSPRGRSSVRRGTSLRVI